MYYSRFTIFLLFILLISSIGCSKGSDPVSGDTFSTAHQESELDILPVVAFDDFSATGVLGAYDLSISDNGTDAILTPMRSSTIGESFIVSGKSFFATRPCVDCLRIASIAMTPGGDVAIGFYIKHPFPKGTTDLPPSGKNRLDLDLFDVFLVVRPNGATPKSFAKLGVSAYIETLVDASGYTGELTNVIADNALLPYKIAFADQSKNRLSMGSSDKYFYAVFSKKGVSFQLYLTMAYGASATFLERLEPTYYVPEFNRKAAWMVTTDSPIFYGADPATLKINIFDWNHGATVASSFPDPVHRDYIKAASNISAVTVEVPGMTNNAVTAVTTDTRTNGWDDPITYTATFSNENGILQGSYIGLVKVLDSRAPGAGMEGDTLIDSPDGAQLIPYSLPEFATFQIFTAIIAPPCGPITGSIISPSCPISGVRDQTTIDFVVTASSANNGNPIVLYEVDYDYDGVNFTADASNTTGVFDDVGPFLNPNCPELIPVNYTVAFRAKDSCIHPNTTIFATCQVTVDICCGPITGDILEPVCPISGVSNNQTLNFVVEASSANSGDPIQIYEADWNYDGSTFDVDASNTTGIFDNAGPFKNPNCPGNGEPATVTVAFRAKDSCNPNNVTIFATCDVTIDICAGWALTWGDTGFDSGNKVLTDSSGNMYVAGHYSGTVDFDPGSGMAEHTSNGQTDIFLSKYNNLGVFQWVKCWGGSLAESPTDVAIDGSGNIFITGYYSGTVDFNPGTGTDEHTSSADSYDAFLSSLASDGTYRWARTWGAGSEDVATGIAINNTSGRIYVCGYFDETVDFDPGSGTNNRSSAGLSDVFVTWFDSSGNHVNVIKVGLWGIDECYDIALDDAGNFIAIGTFMAEVDFDPGAGEAKRLADGFDIFLAKYSADGNFVWVDAWGSTGDEKGRAVIVDSSNKIYATGSFQGTVDFDPGVGALDLTSAGMSDAFLSIFDSNGELVTAMNWGGTNEDVGYGIAINDEHLLVCGSFAGTADFDPTAGTENHVSAGLKDAFVTRFDRSDNSFIRANTWGGTQNDESMSTAFDTPGNILITGYFRTTVDFDPGPFADDRTSRGESDTFFVNLVFD